MADPDIVTRLRESDGGFFMRQMFTESADEIERLRAERDEARHGEAVATATLYGMIEERTALRAERDEARREVCVRMQQTGFLRGDYAAERGWDCYKKEPNDIEAHEVRGDVAGPEGAD